MHMNTNLLKKTLEEVWEDSEFFKFYQWKNFIQIIIKIWIVEHFTKDEFHPWLEIPMETMNQFQREKCIKYITQVRKQQHEVSI